MQDRRRKFCSDRESTFPLETRAQMCAVRGRISNKPLDIAVFILGTIPPPLPSSAADCPKTDNVCSLRAYLVQSI